MNIKPGDSKPAADFLKIFNEHVIKSIKQIVDNPNTKLDIRYCFTLHYPMEPVYKKNLIEAIRASGIYTDNDRTDKLVFVDTYMAMSKYFLQSKPNLRAGSKLLICDADQHYLTIKCMEVVNNEIGAEDIKEEELYKLTDEELGADRIDQYFKAFMLQTLQSHPEHKDGDEQELDGIADIILRNFMKNIKYQGFNDRVELYISKPSVNLFKKSEDPYLTIRVDDLKKYVFDPVIDKVCVLVDKIWKQFQPDAFFLTGNLSSSEYLFHKLCEIVEDVTVVHEKDLSAAKGAVYHGLKEPLSIQRVTLINKNLENVVRKIDDSYYDFDYSSYTHVIGIDFGTSFSKWYYASTKSDAQPAVFVKETMQIPTLSLYDHRAHELKLWGTEAYQNYYGPHNSGKLLTRFKLLLNDLTTEGYDEYTAIDAIARYLKALHGAILNRMKELLGNESANFRYSLTVPTIWSDKTKKNMREAALSAGIIQRHDHPCRLMLVNEPEAAAMFYSKDTFFKQVFPDKNSFRALVCDAGGGTVDMATFEYNKSKDGGYSIDEVTPGSGGICGSSILDDRFRKLINEKCYVLEYLPTGYVREQMVNQFALEIKDTFLPSNNDKNIEIRVPENTEQPNGKLEVTPNELTALVFEPITDDVLKLIEGQHRSSNVNNKGKETLDVIILTGGLGQSKYLQNKVKARYPGILVYSPSAYDQSVVRGAVSLALNPNMITQRIVTKCYGFETLSPYNPVKDLAINRVSGLSGKYTKFKYDNFVEKGMSVKTYECFEKTYYVEYPNNTYAALYSSYHNDDRPIFSVLDPRIEQIFRFDIDIPKLPDKENGELVPVIIRIFPGQTEIKIEMRIEDEYKRLSFKFEQLSDKHRQEIEKLHTKKTLSRPSKKGIVDSKAERFGSSFSFLLGKKNDKKKL